MTPEPEAEPRLSELVTAAVQDAQILIRGQVELAKAEIARSAKRGVIGAALLFVAAFLVLFALLLLAFAAVYGLVRAGLDPWAAFLIVAGVLLLITAILGFIAKVQFGKITGPVMAREELQKTKAAFAGGGAGAAASETGTKRQEKEPVSATVFPSYDGRPPNA
jgi:cytochrome c biogenesis protein CcdA